MDTPDLAQEPSNLVHCCISLLSIQNSEKVIADSLTPPACLHKI